MDETSSYIDKRDPRTQPFTSAEFGNVWALHRAEVFNANDLTPFLREWKEWLAAHDAEVRAAVSQEDPDTQGWRMVYIERHNVRTAYERALAAEKERDDLARQLAEVRAGVVAEEPDSRSIAEMRW